MKKILNSRRAQTIIEYGMLFAAIVAMVVMMGNYVHRSLNASTKRTAEGITVTLNNVDRY